MFGRVTSLIGGTTNASLIFGFEFWACGLVASSFSCIDNYINKKVTTILFGGKNNYRGYDDGITMVKKIDDEQIKTIINAYILEEEIKQSK